MLIPTDFMESRERCKRQEHSWIPGEIPLHSIDSLYNWILHMTVSTEDTTFEGMEAEEKNKQQHKTFDANMHKSTISSQLFGKN